MSESTFIDLGLNFWAYKPTWTFFTSDEPKIGDEKPSLGIRAEWLSHALQSWVQFVEAVLSSRTYDSKFNTKFEAELIDPKYLLSMLMFSLGNASNTILAFKRMDHQVAIPEGFVRWADSILTWADEAGVQAEDLTLQQVARRYTAAISHLTQEQRQVRIDEGGRVFDAAGRRLFEFDPEKVLRGRAEVKAGQTHSLTECGDAEGQNGL